MISIRNPKRKKAFITLTPLMDALTIILVFMLANYKSTPDAQTESPVNLPTVTSLTSPPSESELKDSLKVFLSPTRVQIESNVFDPTQFSAITDLLSQVREKRIMQGQATSLLVHGDTRIPMSLVLEVLKSASAARITHVKLLALQGAAP